MGLEPLLKERNIIVVRYMAAETRKDVARIYILTSICVHSDPIHGTWFQLHTSPLFKDRFDSIPNLAFEILTTSSESTRFNVYHVRWSLPVIDVGVAFRPVLLLSFVLVFLPVVSQHIEYLLGCLDFLEASVGVVLQVVSKMKISKYKYANKYIT